MARPRVMPWMTTSALVLGVVLGGASAAAQEGTPAAGAPELPEGCTVVAEGLVNPRYLAIADDGTIYVTEAGVGGDEEVAPLGPPEDEVAEEVIGTPAAEIVDEAATPAPADEEDAPAGEEGPPAASRGGTGQVTAVSPDGTQSVVVTGLPSYSFGSGPAGIVLADGQVWVAIGGAAAAVGSEPLPNENSVVQIDPQSAAITLVADLGSFEVANNPDGTDINPNVYGMDLGADGQLYVADAGGNTVYRVDPATGTFALLGVVPELPLPAELAPPDATPSPDAPATLQAVPTAVHVGADGNVYVGLLGALVPGAGGIQIAQADGTFVDAATGLSSVVGVALGPDGALYASQIFVGGTEAEPGPGSIVRTGPDGANEVVFDDLAAPHGIAFDQEGNLYVVVNSVAFGPGEPQGQVLRCEGVAGLGGAAPAATPVAAAVLGDA